MNCPHCGAELPEKPGRFCEACGLSVRGPVRENPAEPKRASDEAEPTRCPACGLPTRPPRCPACFTRIPSSEE